MDIRKTFQTALITMAVIIPFNICAFEWPTVTGNEIVVEPLILLEKNAYGALWGGGFMSRMESGQFVLMYGLKGYYGSAGAIEYDDNGTTMYYGLYKEWRVSDETGVSDVNISHFRGEITVGAGWNSFDLFERKQFINFMLSVSVEGAYFQYHSENENTDKEASVFRIGLFSPYIYLSTELFHIDENPVFLNAGTGVIMTGFIGKYVSSFVRVGLSYEFKVKPNYIYDKEEYEKRKTQGHEDWKVSGSETRNPDEESVSEEEEEVKDETIWVEDGKEK